VVSAWAVTALLLVAVVVDAASGDRGGLVLFTLAAVAAGAFAAHSTFVQPRLAADTEGISVRTLGGTHRLPWAETRVRLRTTRRLGREGGTREIEHDCHVIRGWWNPARVEVCRHSGRRERFVAYARKQDRLHPR